MADWADPKDVVDLYEKYGLTTKEMTKLKTNLNLDKKKTEHLIDTVQVAVEHAQNKNYLKHHTFGDLMRVISSSSFLNILAVLLFLFSVMHFSVVLADFADDVEKCEKGSHGDVASIAISCVLLLSTGAIVIIMTFFTCLTTSIIHLFSRIKTIIVERDELGSMGRRICNATPPFIANLQPYVFLVAPIFCIVILAFLMILEISFDSWAISQDKNCPADLVALFITAGQLYILLIFGMKGVEQAALFVVIEQQKPGPLPALCCFCDDSWSLDPEKVSTTPASTLADIDDENTEAAS